ncbi:MAG: nickel-responsive transcriptional regulator NikR [Verrucomicrobiota bacterium]|nr:nickel-responsive transcriptional regulator NikR [Verrucomicrobiota bacterium]
MSGGKKSKLVRFSISIPQDVALGLDRMTTERGFSNRSQCLTSLVRDQLLGHAGDNGSRVMMGLISLIYDHRKPRIQRMLTELQHQHLKEIVTIQLVHLENHHTLQVLLVQGPVKNLRALANGATAIKGVRHGSLQLNSELLPPLY